MQGSIRERSPGVWQVRVSLGRDPQTKRYQYATTTVRGGRRDAQRAAAKLVSQAGEGRMPATSTTLAQLLERWLTHLEGQGRAPKTLRENRRIVGEIAGALGTMPLRKLGAADIDAFYDSLRRRGLAPASVRRYHAVLSAALRQAVRWDLIDRSPAAQATAPTVPTTEPACPTVDQVRALVELAEGYDPNLATFVFVAAATGCRRGELCGLRWSDVDFDAGQLTIRRSVSDVPGQLEVRTTKTGRVRRMALDDATLGILRLQRDRAQHTCAAVGVELDLDSYVWSQQADHGSPWRPARVTASFIALRDKAGLPDVRLHHLRHFAATVMLAGGVDVRTAAGRLGHSQPTLTLRTYAHVLDASDRRAAELLGSSLAQRRGQ